MNIAPASQDITLNGFAVTLREMGAQEKKAWALIHIEAGIVRIRHRQVAQDTLEADLEALLRADVALVAYALRWAGVEVEMSFVFGLTTSQQQAVIAAQDRLNQMEALAKTLDLSRLYAERGVAEVPMSEESQAELRALLEDAEKIRDERAHQAEPEVGPDV